MANIILNTDDLTLTIEERGETNTMTNVGTGAGVYQTKTGSNLALRRLQGGTNISTTENSDNISIDVVWDESIIPVTDQTHDLGSPTNKFADLHSRDLTIVRANGRGEFTSPDGVYWQTVAGNFEVDATDNDIVLRTDASNQVHIINNLVIDGNLDVNGEITTIDTTNLTVEDALIELNSGGDLRDSGLIVNRTGVDNAVFYWDEDNTEFRMVTAAVSSLSTAITGAAWADLGVSDLDVHGVLTVTGTSNLGAVSLSGGLDMNSNSISEVNNLTVTGQTSLANTSFSSYLDMNGNAITEVANLQAHDTTLEIGTLNDFDMVSLAEATGVTVNQTLSTTANLSVGTHANIQGELFMHNQNISDVNTLSATGVDATDSVTAGTWMSIGDPQGGSYFENYGALNSNYLNVTSPDFFNSSMQLVHGLATDDDFHQMIRMKTDMFDQTPYDHKFGFFAETNSDGRGGENIGEFFFRYRENGNMGFIFNSENLEFGPEEFITTVVDADSKSITFGAPARLLSVEVGATLPGSPAAGDRFIHSGVLKIYADGTWNNYDPGNGSMVYDTTNNRTLVRENGAWRAITTTAI